jgi:hypothetical protein
MTDVSALAVPPRTPSDVPDQPIDVLAARYEAHKAVVLRRTPHLTRAEKQAHARAVLAVRAVLMDRLDRAGWDLTIAALRAGLTVDEAAESMRLDPSGLLVYLAAGINERWPADAERDEEYTEIMTLIAAATPDSPT